MRYVPLSQREELIAKHTVHAAYTRLGFLINFNVPLIKSGIRRFVL